jgi:RimJ/RimL family protein N-acetyltransferase
VRSILVEPVVLTGRFVRLEPLDLHHASGLAQNLTADIHEFFQTVRPEGASIPEVEEYIRRRQAMPAQLSFAVIELSSGQAVGCTSYLDIRPTQLGLEIGMTWYGKRFQRTAVNPECKLLLLRHAFEVLGCERVQLKTDSRNLQSQAAIEKLGAAKEGVLRNHRYMPLDVVSDTVMYSIVPSEWPQVERGLISRLESA